MTLANLVDTGSGRFAARWEIEGLPVEFVTDPGMEQSLGDGRRRLCVTSLEACGFAISERTNVPEALLEMTGTSLALWETDSEDLAGVFHHRPELERWGPTTLEELGTTLRLYSVEGIEVGDVLHCGTEALRCTSIISATEIGVDRAVWGTVAQFHYSSDTPDHPDMMITNRPIRVRGRQVRLWLYGDGDDLLGNGFQRWLGIVNAEPMITGSGTVYRLSFAGINSRLRSKIGGDLDLPVRPRGIYYPATAALRVQIHEYSPSLKAPFDLFTGFYETQAEFVVALEAWLTTPGASAIADAGLDSTYRAEVTSDGRWTIRVTLGGSTSDVAVGILSEQDGVSTLRIEDMLGEDGLPIGIGTPPAVVYPDIIWLSRDGHRGGSVPRGFFGESPDVRLHRGSAALSAPRARIYPNRAVDPARWSSAATTWPGSTGSRVHQIVAADAGDDWIELGRAAAPIGEALTPPGWVYTSTLLPELQLLWTLAVGSLATAQLELLAMAPEFANLGVVPFVTDRDLAGWTGVVGREAVLPWQRQRFYAFSRSVDFEEFLAHECRLLGLYPGTDLNGKLTLVPLDVPHARTRVAFNIDEEISHVDGQAVELSSMARGNQTVNRVVLRTGYDAREDEWTGFIEVQDRTSFALDHADRPLEITPRSWAVGSVDRGDGAIAGDEVAAVVLPVLSLFGYPHELVDVKVSWRAFDLRIGHVVTFSADHLPHYIAGRRPISSVTATVLGRDWKLGDPFGTLTLLLSWQNVAGYAPTARVATAEHVSGDTWDLTVDQTLYAPSGAVPEEFFAAGDEVRLAQLDTEAAAPVAGTVVSVNTALHVIRVSLAESWTPGSDTWELMFARYDVVGADQRSFAYYATRELIIGSGDAPRTLAA